MKKELSIRQQWKMAFSRHLEIPGRIQEKDAIIATNVPVPEGMDEILEFFFAIEGLTDGMQRWFKYTPSFLLPSMRRFIAKWTEEEMAHAQVLCALWKKKVLTREELDELALSVASPDFLGVQNYQAFKVWCLAPIFPLIHLIFGAVSETITHFAYMRLREKINDSEFTKIVEKIRADESAHYQAYFSAAKAVSRIWGGRKLVNFLVKNFYSPVGKNMMTRKQQGQVVKFFFEKFNTQEFESHLEKWLGELLDKSVIKIVARKTVELASYA